MNDNSSESSQSDPVTVHPSSLGWKHVRDNLWQKPDGNYFAFAPSSRVQVYVSDNDIEKRLEQIRFGIG